MKKRKKILLLILLLLLFSFIVFLLVRTQEGEVDQATVSRGDFVESYMSSIRAEMLPLDKETTAGLWGYYDAEDKISYIGQVNAKTGAGELLAIEKNTGEQAVRYTASKEEVVTVAGAGDSLIVFYVSKKAGQSCEDLWSTENVYYGISQGLVSYSGAAGLLIEKDEDLIQDMLTTCNMVK